MRLRTAIVTAVGVAGAAAGVDQGSKAWIRSNVIEEGRGPRLGPLSTTHVEHRMGHATAATDASRQTSMGMLIAAPLALAVGIGAAKLLGGTTGALAAVSGGLLTAAAASNGVEMLARGSVTDFIDMPPDHPQLVANVADLSLIAGGTGLTAVCASVFASAVRHR